MRRFPLLWYWKQDLPASVVVFLVALPLCLGIAVASGAPPIAGVVAGAVGGIVIGLTSRSPLGVSGPAAGLTTLVLGAVTELGAFELVLCAVMLAGVIQLVLGFLRAGIIAYYFPNAVIHGMLAGIGVLIILTQLTHGVGYDRPAESVEDYHWTDLRAMLDNITPGAVVVTLACLALMILWDRPFVKNNKVLKVIPGSMLAVVAGIVLGVLFNGHAFLHIGAEHFVNIPDIAGLSDLPRPDWSGMAEPRVWQIAGIIAVVASLETLWKRVTPANRELHAQGIGNIVSGFLGGLPLTQVVVRSSANIQTGGRSNLSTVVHGLLIVTAVLIFPGLLRMVPLSSLAAVLFLVGYKLIKPKQFVEMWHDGPMRFIPFVVTVVGVAFIGLLNGVLMGLMVSIVHILWKNYRVPFHLDIKNQSPERPIHLELSEDVTFLNKAGIKRTLDELPDGVHVIIDASRTMDLDPDVKEIIDEFARQAQGRNITLRTVGLKKHYSIRSNADLARAVQKVAAEHTM
jgi:MFS superfamily sulfate permease-like transporter